MVNWLNSLLGRPAVPYPAQVEIYTWQTCPYCIRAKLLLWWKGVNFTEYKIDGDDQARQQMGDRAEGRRTVPQIFINNHGIGGCNELYALDTQGNLDRLLSQPANPS
ncbi:MAG: glutaredoxin 3 [Prochlorothrix sp.]